MSIWNKVLVGLLIVVGAAYLFFAARALKARSHWGKSIQQHEEALAAVAQQKQILMDGNPAETKPGFQEGVRRMKQEVHRLVIGRGRVWRGSVPRLVKGEGASVMTQLPAPHLNVQNAHLFVFEEPSNQSKGAFLGEFAVAKAADRLWELQSVRPMTEAEQERLRKSGAKKAAWTMYEVMPGEPMEAVSEAAASTAGESEAKREPTPAKVGSPEWQQGLVDYHVMLNELYRQRAKLEDLIALATSDTQAVEGSVAAARQGVDLLQKDIAATKEELKAMQAQRDLVAKHFADLEAKYAQLKDAVQKIEQANRAAAGELARLQLEAVRRIDERTNKVARAAVAR